MINGEDYGGSHPGSPFGLYNDGNDPDIITEPANIQITQANVMSSVHIDDIVIGLAERGEMVTGAAVDAGFIDNIATLTLPETNGTFTTYRGGVPGIGLGDTITTQTDYQLEIRTSREHLGQIQINQGLARPIESYYSPNQRLAEGVNIVVVHAGGEIIDSDHFTIPTAWKRSSSSSTTSATTDSAVTGSPIPRESRSITDRWIHVAKLPRD